MKIIVLRPILGMVLLSTLGAGGACAMNQERVLEPQSCSVSGGEKILEPAGGAKAVCGEIEKALAEKGRAGAASVAVLARRSHLTATVRLADGRMLPQLGFAVSDAPLSRNAIKRFALEIAEAVRSAT